MTGLLISVRSAAEAKVALAGGADIIDVKEPRHGALGAAPPSVWRSIQAAIGSRATVSAALGELHDESICGRASEAAGFAYAKIGLSNWRRQHNSPARWFAAWRALPPGVCAVPVVYADVEATGWRSFEASAAAAIALSGASQSPLVVFDTFEKHGATLLDLVDVPLLEVLSRKAAQRGIRLVIAGSLNAESIERLLPAAPAYIGVRGAACSGGRDGTIDLARVKSLSLLIHARRQMAAG